MDPLDPLSRYQYEMSELFSLAPSDFEMKPGKLTWEGPCWLDANILLCPQSEPAKKKFFLNLTLPHKVDAFAREPWENQLWAGFSPRLEQIIGPHANEWWPRMMHCYRELKLELKHTDAIFRPPFHFVGRGDFETVNLAAILKEVPENLSVYLAVEKGSYCEYMFLRIHTSPPFLSAKPRCLWFEKRLPDSLHTEDVMPWFLATISRLPKKDQPADLDAWRKRFLHFEPHLSSPTGGTDKSWIEKPKLILVLGPTAKVGYRALSHFERRDIRHVVRQNEIIRIDGTERYPRRDNTAMEIERTFYLFAFDASAAERVEKRILSGVQVHFGLDADVLGMICRSGHVINAINVPEETIRRLCVEPELELRLIGNPRYKLKMYEVCTPDTPRLEDFA